MLTILRQPPIVVAMIAEIDSLETKIRLVAERCQALGNENMVLRQSLLIAQQENKQLTFRLDSASTRLQALLNKIPEEA